ncbi:MAG TPA: hypothetical protein VGG68_01005 [Caulobacteraceae bacterium]|jgi:hypothetical protein
MTRLPIDHCPYCGKPHDSATNADPGRDERPPEPGDASMCIGCGSMLIFDDDLKLSKPDPETLQILLSDARVQQMIGAWLEGKFGAKPG